MARIELSGFAELEFDMEQWANIPQSVFDRMVEVQIPIVESASKSEKWLLQTRGRYVTGTTAGSISHSKLKHQLSKTSADIYPKGTNKRGNRNAELGFIWEFGATTNRGVKIPPAQWMRIAAEKCAEECADAAKKVHDEYLDKINL